MELREKLESIEKRKQSDDLIIQLASSFEENMGKLQAIVSQQPSHFSSTPTTSSSPRGSNPDDLMVLSQVVGQHGTMEQLLKKPLSMLQWDITCLNATPTLARER
ncbi:hypothetical protein OUZ56_003660 [Daphnia magna]|uniref:Uncharacterized protein n=1 Tax=Daphnia magna TaxID=35525 RepID=A0ABR0A9D5_9CRUS|nr:hypothetical protein OUZ56_003660 [Daphnia magna]